MLFHIIPEKLPLLEDNKKAAYRMGRIHLQTPFQKLHWLALPRGGLHKKNRKNLQKSRFQNHKNKI
jgi:hypothetical protein